MKLTATPREGGKKGTNKAMRRKGNIPAVFYFSGKEGKDIEIDGTELAAHLRSIPKGHLSITVFDIEIDGKKHKALVKDVQYHRTTYNIIHLDLMGLDEKTPVKVKVPVEFTGVADCAGIKLGGVLRQVIRQVKVECLPKDIPGSFQIDVSPLQMKQKRRLSDIAMPAGVRPLVGTSDEVVVVIAKR